MLEELKKRLEQLLSERTHFQQGMHQLNGHVLECEMMIKKFEEHEIKAEAPAQEQLEAEHE